MRSCSSPAWSPDSACSPRPRQYASPLDPPGSPSPYTVLPSLVEGIVSVRDVALEAEQAALLTSVAATADGDSHGRLTIDMLFEQTPILDDGPRMHLVA